jgi:hypothetical protein
MLCEEPLARFVVLGHELRAHVGVIVRHAVLREPKNEDPGRMPEARSRRVLLPGERVTSG